MKRLAKIVVVGFGSIEKDNDGNWQTKQPIAEYINGLAEGAEEVVWFINHNRLKNQNQQATINSDKIRVRAYKYSTWSWFRMMPGVLKESKGAGVILHMPTSTHLYPLYKLIKRRSVALAVYIGDDYEAYCKTGTGLTALKRRMILMAHRTLVSIADLVVARGKHLASVAMERNRNVIETVPLAHMPTEVQTKPLPTAGEPFNILCVSKLAWCKGFKEFIDAYDQLVQEGRHKLGKLYIVGDDLGGNNIEGDAIREYARTKACCDHIVFTGYLYLASELEKYWQACPLLVMPTSSHNEGVPRVIDEALSRGLGIVSTTIGGVGAEFASSPVVLVKPADTGALRTGIEQVLDHPETLADISAYAKSRFEFFQQQGSPGKQHYQALSQCIRK